jgi:bifunctional N-acetylglucosamine-1-phosphate-uridyltransferase/glucosamine-1-phosphate-acetyltransferase GlmU-like protein
VPLIRQSTLENLIVQAQKSGVALLSVMLDNPTGYGRIMRKDNQIQAIRCNCRIIPKRNIALNHHININFTIVPKIKRSSAIKTRRVF